MKKITKTSLFLLLPAVFLLSQGCATIFGGRSNSLSFINEEQTEAQVFLDDSLIGNASDKILLSKGVIQHGSMLEIKAEGYKTQEYLILLKPHAGYMVADFVVGAVPLIIDFGTGDILRPKPRKFEIEMEKKD